MEMTTYNIGTIIYNRRTELNLSSEELGDKAFVSDTTITRLENGVSIPNLKTLLNICSALGLELEIKER